MTFSDTLGDIPPTVADAAPRSRALFRWRYAEDALVVVALAALVALPLAEIALRALFHTGLAGSATLVQHLTLFISMAGGALAARDGRLLAFSTLPHALRGTWAAAARIFSHAVAGAVAGALAIASVQYVAVERGSAPPFLGGVPLWIIESVLPVGFAFIALRIITATGLKRSRDGVIAALGAAALLALGAWPPVPVETLLWPAAALLVAAAGCGAPVFVLLGGLGLILFWGHDLPIAAMPVEHYRLVVNPTLPAIPLFTLTGYFLAEGSIR
jgi:TRAP-type C4-dicarboxylate transport system permease small subunit